MDLDPVLLSRIQFAFVVSFHAIFPVFTIGLAAYIAVLEGLFFRTHRPVYLQLSQFWTRVFALVFGMGVVSGIVMSFQFGTNWSTFSYQAANFFGPVLSYEVVTAFFLEATFLGVLLFGRDKVPPGVHLFAACMVAVGTFISSFWILAANSWMQTPAGVDMVDGVLKVTSWGEAIFNASLPYRFAHMGLASFITGGFVVAGVSAWYLLKGQHRESSLTALKMSLLMLAVVTPLQLFVGDLHGLNTLEEQPVKVAAMEGHWETRQGAPLILFAIPDSNAEKNHFEIGIPNLGSLILTHSLDGEVQGLKSVPAEDRPPVGIVFWSFRVMVAVGLIFIGVSILGAIQILRGRLEHSPRLLRVINWMIPLPFVAVLAGWFVTEVGRQPWIIYGLMRASEAVTPSLSGGMVLATLIGYIAVYATVFTAGITYLRRVILTGPPSKADQGEMKSAHAKRPWSAVGDSSDKPAAEGRS
ncbi:MULTISPECIES: cytochrome ubiquinol oxidase subunit I [unclassified Wenzhouxiangella]|uniref:cytochrome ubiquinol oxidase subunit I n=1 Tax=unclassified Wenzhouxiangella TaxID=2613841 RepID=UPI000E32522D|nr:MULTISPECIES: cytochrome ubiquinol oxidase subunit I [unclassified Wenzhouxiangella]RFF27766.1 cytochrome ubiquinol oxidase subunit I [Wenzhouxiangella sp. 15181]RFP68395.1 cytochrome ubiquinol oxidase subunit I [Wenzhouxiangella sp. 15190]